MEELDRSSRVLIAEEATKEGSRLHADQVLQDYDTTLAPYEARTLPETPSFTLEQQNSLLEQERYFADQKEWRSIYLKGLERGLDENKEVALAVYRSNNPTRNDRPEGYQVRSWDDTAHEWKWLDVANVIVKNEEFDAVSGSLFTIAIVLQNGQTLEIVLHNSFDDRNQHRQELQSARYTAYPETEFSPVSPPKKDVPERGVIPSSITPMPVQLSEEQKDERDIKRVRNKDRRARTRSLVGASAVHLHDRY